MKPTLNVASIFSGAGGIDIGFEAAGFRTRIAIDADPDCRASLRLNTDWRVPEDGDVFNWSGEKILRECGVRRGCIEMLVAGPPCQPFSKAGYWHSGDARRMSDERAKTIDALFNILRGVQPEVVLIENVPGLAFKGKDEGLQRIISGFRSLNRSKGSAYEPSVALLDAADYGAPQHRRRIFIVAHKGGSRFRFPVPSHGADRLPHINAWSSLRGAKDDRNDDLRVTGKWATLLPSIPEGENYLWHSARGGGLPIFGWRTRYWSFLLKLAKARPAWTISASPGSASGPFHWESRKLAVAELKRLQTFPDRIRFTSSYRSIVRMLGNAVPPLLAEVLALEIRSQFFGEMRSLPTLGNVKRAMRVPPPEKLQTVPRQFVPSRGQVPPSEHPGEGAGPGAILRRRRR